MPVAKIGKRGMMVLPSEVRRKAGIDEGDEVLVEADERGTIHIMRRPKDFTAALKNLHSDIWQGIDPIKYVRQERNSWEQ